MQTDPASLLMHGDCLDLMSEIPDRSVDLILADLPYGSTKCGWDQRIDLARFWGQAERLLSLGSGVVMFADMRFGSELIQSQPKWFRYDLVWDKVGPIGWLDAIRRPMRRHELILVFGPKLPRYRPQKWQSPKPVVPDRPRNLSEKRRSPIYDGFKCEQVRKGDKSRFPVSIQRFDNSNCRGKFHPTEKPVNLLSYLIPTYTDPGMTVLDPTMGSGSTGVACLQTGREFIGIERDGDYFQVAKARLERARSESEQLFETA